jgi:hypothetical protein
MEDIKIPELAGKVCGLKSSDDPVELMLLMGGPGGLGPPGGGVTGAAPPLRGVVEARRAGTRGRLPPLFPPTIR